jgi:hypothetical protein
MAAWLKTVSLAGCLLPAALPMVCLHACLHAYFSHLHACATPTSPSPCREGLVAGGGFGGELVVQRLGSADRFACSQRVTTSDNGITNAIEIYRAPQGQVRRCIVVLYVVVKCSDQIGLAPCMRGRHASAGAFRLLLALRQSPPGPQLTCLPSVCVPCWCLRCLQVRVMCSNNDDTVRSFDAETFQRVR